MEDAREELWDLQKKIREEKNKGKKIVMTCGCFSILHPGHIECFQIGKRYGDYLIVGINSDDYIVREKRIPFFFNQKERKKILRELRCVDNVFVFQENNFSSSLEILRPDVYVKGPDYVNKLDSEEKDICAQFSIQIVFAGERKMYSSSEASRRYGEVYE